MSIESFLEHHILEICGSSLLRIGQNKTFSYENPLKIEISINILRETNDLVQGNHCRLCTEETFPSPNAAAHTCISCGTPIQYLKKRTRNSNIFQLLRSESLQLNACKVVIQLVRCTGKPIL
jgi:hypothetical protein